jgi:hypothetical protein
MRTALALVVASLVACGSSSPTEPPVELETGDVRLTLTTSGPGAPATLLLHVDDSPPTTLPANGAQLIAGLTEGEHHVRIAVPGQCTSTRFSPLSVEVEPDAVTPAQWSIHCPAPAPPGITFERWRNGFGTEIWRADPDGGQPRVIPTPGDAFRPVMNPARTRIAWHAIGGPNGLLRVMDLDGTRVEETELGTNGFDWSPDGTMFVVARGAPNGLSLHWPDGSHVRTLRNEGASKPAWSPDGTRIAYRSGSYIYVLDLGTGARLNTGHVLNSTQGGSPAWSPDGTRLAFDDIASGRVLTIRADGTDLREATGGITLTSGVDWADNGTLLISRAQPNPVVLEPALLRIPADGGTATILVQPVAGGHDTWPRWAP